MGLDKIIDVAKWQVLQNSIATVTKMAIITVDYKGIPITSHSEPCPFCQYIRSQPNLQKYCFKCDSRGGLEAVRINAPYIYLCHCNIVDIAIPIMIDGKYIGAIMGGQIRLPEEEKDIDLEKILLSPSKEIFKSEEVRQMYNRIPTLSYTEIKQIANMLFHLSNYIVEEAVNKNVILEMYGEIANRSHVYNRNVINDNSFDRIQMQRVNKSIGDAVTNAYIKTNDAYKRASCRHPVLRPAFDYIYENKGMRVTQKHMADLCHISTSHFSRMFAKEVGENFSSFLSRLKVQWSKQLLEETDMPITQISEDLGFSETSYYIKIFKKYENITPSIYRKYHLETKEKEDHHFS